MYTDQRIDDLSQELICLALHKSDMTIEEAVEWIREWIRYIDQKPITTSSLLARKLYDIMIEDQRCPRCGVKFEHLSYVERLQTNYFYRCPECGEMY